MTTQLTKKDLLNDILGTEFKSDGGYHPSELQIINIDIARSSVKSDNVFEKSIPDGTYLLVVECGVLTGPYKGQTHIFKAPYFKRSGNDKLAEGKKPDESDIAKYYTFTGDDETEVPASLYGDIMHRVHEKEGQEKSKLQTGLKFDMELKTIEVNGELIILPLTERQRIKDEKWRVENQEDKVTEKETDDVEVIDPDSLPF